MRGCGEVNGLPLTVDPSALEPLLDAMAEKVAERIAPPPEPYIDADKAAEYLACDRRRIYDLVERRAVKSYRDGRRVLFRHSDLDSYLKRS
jgi:excisionase family DNA binding protein